MLPLSVPELSARSLPLIAQAGVAKQSAEYGRWHETIHRDASVSSGAVAETGTSPVVPWPNRRQPIRLLDRGSRRGRCHADPQCVHSIPICAANSSISADRRPNSPNIFTQLHNSSFAGRSLARAVIQLALGHRYDADGAHRMQSYRKELWFNLPNRMDFVNITPQVEACVAESGVQEGLCLVNAMHITASVFINDDEPGLHRRLQEMARSSSRRSIPRPSATTTTAPAKTTPTPITSGRSWAARWSWRSPTASSTSARGSKSSTANSTAAARNACW